MKNFSLHTLLVFAVATSACGAERRCTDASGKVLYIVSDTGRVTDASGRELGRVTRSSDVYDPSGRLLARNGDAGLLLSLSRPK